MVLSLILGIITTLILMSFPGYIFACSLKMNKNSFLSDYFFGLIIMFSFLIIGGFILSYFKLFKFIFLISFIIILNLISLSLLIKRKQNLNLNPSNKEKIIIIMFVLIILGGFIYSLNSNFPIGFDRGKHFGMSLFLTNNNYLSSNMEGTDYNQFYFQGQNLLLTSLTRISLMYNAQDISSFDYILGYSHVFKFYFNFIVALSILALYFLTRSLYENQNLVLLCCVSFFIFSFELIKTGSIGAVLVFLYVIIFFFLLNYLVCLSNNKYQKKNNLKKIYLLLILTLFMIMLIHIIGFFIALIISLLIILINLRNKDVRLNLFKKILSIFILSCLIYVIFLLIFKQELLWGIFQEIIRKKIETGTPFGEEIADNSIINYFKENLSNLSQIMFITLPIIILGFLKSAIKKEFKVILFFISTVLFIIFPILGLPKTTLYLIYPLSIFLGNGLYYTNKDLNIKKNLGLLIIFLLLTISIIQVITIHNYSKSKLYISEEDYINSFNLINILNEQNFNGNILFYSSGEIGYFINSLSKNKILFADPRYLDLPQSIELSKIYKSYPTKYETYVSNVSQNQFNEIIRKNNLSVIISSPGKELMYSTNLEQINTNLQVYNLNKVI